MRFDLVPGYLYVAVAPQRSDAAKIGYTFNPQKRVRTIKSAFGRSRPSLYWSLRVCPHHVAFLAEQLVKRKLSHRAVGDDARADGTEWFWVEPGDLSLIAMAQVEEACRWFGRQVVESDRWGALEPERVELARHGYAV